MCRPAQQSISELGLENPSKGKGEAFDLHTLRPTHWRVTSSASGSTIFYIFYREGSDLVALSSSGSLEMLPTSFFPFNDSTLQGCVVLPQSNRFSLSLPFGRLPQLLINRLKPKLTTALGFKLTGNFVQQGLSTTQESQSLLEQQLSESQCVYLTTQNLIFGSV